MIGKTLIVYSTITGISAVAAHAIADELKTAYIIDVAIADLKDGQPDITPFQNIIVGGGVKGTDVYAEAVDFLEKNFEDRKVALYFCCEDNETPKTQSTENNSKKALAKNASLKPIDVAAFGGCMIKHGQPTMDELNMNRVKHWSVELGKKIIDLNLLNTVPSEYAFQFFVELGKNTGITANSMVEFAEKLQVVPIQSIVFHFQRQDFQKWLKNIIGDEELVKRINEINVWIHNEENLRKELSKTVQNRINELPKSP